MKDEKAKTGKLPWETPVMTVDYAMYEGILCNSVSGNPDDSPGTKQLDIQQMESIDFDY